MKIIIVRHAETTENAKTQDLGHDSEALLTENGVSQAKKLGEYLKSEKITHAYSSPQKRAVHTAKLALEHHPSVEVIEVPDLREQNLGIYEAVSKEEWKAARKNSGQAFHLFTPEKGESYQDVQKRASKFLKSLIDTHKEDDTVLMVSHGGTTGVLLLDIFEKEINEENYKAHKPENTAVTILEIFKDKPMKVHALNSREHLNH